MRHCSLSLCCRYSRAEALVSRFHDIVSSAKLTATFSGVSDNKQKQKKVGRADQQIDLLAIAAWP